MSLFAEPTLCNYVGVPVKTSNRVFYGGNDGVQLLKQIVGALFIRGWNVVLKVHILLAIRMVTPLHICWLVTTLSTERKRMRCGEMERNSTSPDTLPLLSMQTLSSGIPILMPIAK